MILKGNITALVTPLTEDYKVDEQQLIDLIEFQIQSNTNGILFLGGTGEYLALTKEERERIVNLAVKTVNKRVHVMIGNLEPGIGESVSFGKFCKATGADSTLVITPYYIRPTQDGMYEYYKKFTQEVDMPTFIYNFPAKTNVNILPETVAKLAENCPQIWGIKECTGDIGQAVNLLNLVKGKISVLSGDESSSLAHLVLGADGVIMATSNFIPEFWVNLCKLMEEGNVKEGTKLFMNYYDLFTTVYSELNPAPIKYILQLMGKPAGAVSVPIMPVSEQLKERISFELKKRNIV